MKKAITSVAAVAILTVAGMSQAHAWGNIETSFDNSRDNRRDYSTHTGRDSTQNSNNRTTTNRNDNRQDNRQWNDSRDMSDNRDLSDRSVRNTTTTDSRDLSDRRIDSRDLSDRSVRNTTTTNNQQDNQRHQSHNVGGAQFNAAVNARAGHDQVNFGPISGGQGNVMDASINGNTFNLGGGK